MEGLKEWLDAVSTARIPCALVSSLDRRNMVEALDRTGLKNYFQVGDPLNELTCPFWPIYFLVVLLVKS